jgi:hypothetical protein
MFISPGEIARGQWIMIHGAVEREKDYNNDPNTFTSLKMILMQTQEMPSPHLVLAVQVPFVVVADCVQTPAITKIWRTDEKKLVELNEEFVKSYDLNGWHRGQKLLDTTYRVPLPTPRKSV